MRGRILAVAGALVAALAILALRVVELTVVDAAELSARAQRQYVEEVRTARTRGEIRDRNGIVLATTVTAASVYLRLREHRLGAAERTRLAAALGCGREVLDRRLDRSRPFVWLARGVGEAVVRRVEALGIPGLGIVEEGRRIYPHGPLAAHVVGLAGRDLQGLEGLERYYDRWLRGEEVDLCGLRDGRGRTLRLRACARPAAARPLADGLPPAPGASLVLTLDGDLQAVVERELAAGVARARARAGVAILMDPWTGAVLALANVPTYDPNRPGVAPADARRNRAIKDRFEPGSTFKAILAAAAVEEGVIGPAEAIDCERGRYRIGRWVIHDHHPFERLTLAEILERSSNIGAAKVGERLGAARLARYIRAFGFGEPTGVDLPYEASSRVRPPTRWGRVGLATRSFGQGIAVTPLQLVRAFAAIANGGRLVTPYLLESAVAPSGNVLFRRDPATHVALGREVVSPTSARAVAAMLERVVDSDEGTGTRARIAGVRVAGKTGTAQKVRAGRYSKERLASFVGFAPADEPAFVLLVMIDEPQGVVYGGAVAAPVFARVAERVLDHLGRRPGRKVAPAGPPLQPASLGALAGSPAAEAVRHPAGPVVPSFLHMSLRQARRAAAAAGLAVVARGSGYVVAQDPPPGSPRGGEAVSLMLEPSV